METAYRVASESNPRASRGRALLLVTFTATVTRGGPGATLVLEVSGLTFSEIVLEGEIRF